MGSCGQLKYKVEEKRRGETVHSVLEGQVKRWEYEVSPCSTKPLSGVCFLNLVLKYSDSLVSIL